MSLRWDEPGVQKTPRRWWTTADGRVPELNVNCVLEMLPLLVLINLKRLKERRVSESHTNSHHGHGGSWSLVLSRCDVGDYGTREEVTSLMRFRDGRHEEPRWSTWGLQEPSTNTQGSIKTILNLAVELLKETVEYPRCDTKQHHLHREERYSRDIIYIKSE